VGPGDNGGEQQYGGNPASGQRQLEPATELVREYLGLQLPVVQVALPCTVPGAQRSGDPLVLDGMQLFVGPDTIAGEVIETQRVQ
jgi:hypothetical protein